VFGSFQDFLDARQQRLEVHQQAWAIEFEGNAHGVKDAPDFVQSGWFG
jgi:hypothetical protein